MPVIAYLFPGNGAAEANLGRDFYAKVPVVRDYMDRADKALLPLGLKVTKACFVSEPAELRRPSVAGPALMAVSCGVFAALKAKRVHCQLTGAFGWGELSALASFGGVEFEAALKLMRQRGLWLEEAWEKAPFHALAVQGLPVDELEAKLKGLAQPPLRLATLAPDHVVLGGEEKLLKALALLLAKAGRSVKVGAVEKGWDWPHPCFGGVKARLSEALAALKPANLPAPIQGSRDEEPLHDAREWPARASETLCAAPDWPAAARRLRALGMDTAVELGKAQGLGASVHKLDTGVRVLEADNMASYALAVKLAV